MVFESLNKYIKIRIPDIWPDPNLRFENPNPFGSPNRMDPSFGSYESKLWILRIQDPDPKDLKFGY